VSHLHFSVQTWNSLILSRAGMHNQSDKLLWAKLRVRYRYNFSHFRRSANLIAPLKGYFTTDPFLNGLLEQTLLTVVGCSVLKKVKNQHSSISFGSKKNTDIQITNCSSLIKRLKPGKCARPDKIFTLFSFGNPGWHQSSQLLFRPSSTESFWQNSPETIKATSNQQICISETISWNK